MAALQMTWQPSLLKLVKRKHGAPPLGLNNLGNSCYLNSVLQCLTYTPPLASFCLQRLHSSICNFGAGKETGDCPFCILEKRIIRSLSSDSPVDSPFKMHSCVRIYADQFHNGRQEDAHEFLRYVIDACHNTCLRLKKLQQQQRGKNVVSNGGDVSGTEETVVKDIFGGALQSQVKCLSCGAESNKVDEIMDMSLDILHSGSLREALQKFFQPELLDGNNKYKCNNCKELVAARKQMSVIQAPNVLVIQLKRFEGMYGRKIDKPIACDEILELSSHMCKASQDQHPEYNLFGTIVHSGFSPDSGHYYAYIKDAIGRWYCCNDSYVSVSTLQEVLSEKVYILFFSRKKQRPQTSSDVVVNGSMSHESNGSKTSTTQKSGCLEKPFCTTQVSNHQSETNNSTKSLESNGPRLVFQKSSSEKPFRMKISANHSETNNSTKSKVNGGLSSQQRKFSDSGSTNKPLPLENVGTAVCKRESRQENGCTAASVTSPEKEKTNFPVNESNGFSKRPSLSRISNGHITDSVERSLPEAKGSKIASTSRESVGSHILPNGGIVSSKTPSASRESVGSHILPNGGIVSSSNSSGKKRKIAEDHSCIFLATDEKSRAELETFKELIGKEASTILRSCGWSDEVRKFMHAKKKAFREAGDSASNEQEMKSLLISQAKRSFIPKIPVSLKATLVDRLKSFNQGKQSSGK